METPDNFQFTHGDSIHTSRGNAPHLRGTVDGNLVHLPYSGQTTLGMFDRSLPGHRLADVEALHEKFPETFRDSGLSSG